MLEAKLGDDSLVSRNSSTGTLVILQDNSL